MTADLATPWPSFDDVRLETARLVLRPLTGADVPALHRIFSDAQVQRYTLETPWTSTERAVRHVEEDRRRRAAGEILRLAIERRDDGAVIGTCDLFSFERASRRAELGYSLDRAAWGQGYAREAVGRLLDFGFEVLGLNRVEADIDPRNAASERLLVHFGFRHEGLLRERWLVGTEVSHAAMWGLLASDRAARNGTAGG
jgi:RimJ/RimL family protein N-acetyltransferase